MVSKKKDLHCAIQTIDKIVTFTLTPTTTGQQLIDMVFANLGVYEKHWFGLYYYDLKENGRWLDMKKKIHLKDIKPFDDTHAHFKFTIRYFPESMNDELIQDKVKILFFKFELSRIVTDNQVYISPEYRVLTAVAFACLLAHENPGTTPEDVINKKFDRLFPAHVLSGFDLTKQEWLDAIEPALTVAKSQHYTEPLHQALDCLENSPMHGITYYDIKNSRGTELLLGVDCLGLTVYSKNIRIEPQVVFSWEEIHRISYEARKFVIEVISPDSPDLVFFAKSTRTCDEMLNCIAGNHQQFRSRRQGQNQGHIDVKEATEAQKIAAKEKELFEKQKESQIAYEKAVSEVMKSGANDDSSQIVEQSYNQVKDAMEQQISEAKRLAEEERRKRDKAEKEIEELRKLAKDMEEKLAVNSEAKEILTLLEVEHANVDENRVKEIERLQKMLKDLEQKHLDDIKRLEELKLKQAEAPPSEETTEKKPETAENYHQVKIRNNKQLRDNINKFGTMIKAQSKMNKSQPVHVQNYAKEGRGKFETLKNLRKNNTRARIDQFESL